MWGDMGRYASGELAEHRVDLPISPLYLPTSPYISPYISPTSPHISRRAGATARHGRAAAPLPAADPQLLGRAAAVDLRRARDALRAGGDAHLRHDREFAAAASNRPSPTTRHLPRPQPPRAPPALPASPPHRSPLTAPPSSPGMPIASNPRGEGRKLRSVGYSGGPQARLYVPLTDAAGDEGGFRPCVGDEEGEV